MSIIVEFPEQVKQFFGWTEEEMPRKLLELIAIEGYRERLLSRRQVGELLGLNFWETEQLLKEREAHLHLTLEDIQEDVQTMRKVVGGMK